MERFAGILPREDFPLSPHLPTNRWYKTVRGIRHYFGSLDDPDGALAEWLRHKDAIHATGQKLDETEGFTVAQVCARFMAVKSEDLACGAISARTIQDWQGTCELVVRSFGKSTPAACVTTERFAALGSALKKRYGPVRRANEIGRVKGVFRFAFEEGIIPTLPRYGKRFQRPGKDVVRRHRAKQPARIFTASEVRRLIDRAGDIRLQAAILLGVNGGFGASDCSTLQEDHIDWNHGFYDHARAKTGVPRRFKLWPETVEALRQVVGERPIPAAREHAGLVFITNRGLPVVRVTRTSRTDYFSVQFTTLRRSLKIGPEGAGLYTLRRLTETIGGRAKDQAALDYVMGHSSGHISEQYREWLHDDSEDARLQDIADVIHDWVWPEGGEHGGDADE
ncbi:MAG: hypothetical protein D8M59_14465 [Planctomycetes bacterium]|nr:hypothetical protein [Planctomycetota bacterium]NOG53314.1 hypothetical protein [Planctomycetota bacterium]